MAGKEKSYDSKKVITQVKNTDLVEQKHHQIVQAASRLFSEKGYHKTSLRDISRESGINLSYIYKYISKKDDILYLFYQYIETFWFFCKIRKSRICKSSAGTKILYPGHV